MNSSQDVLAQFALSRAAVDLNPNPSGFIGIFLEHFEFTAFTVYLCLNAAVQSITLQQPLFLVQYDTFKGALEQT